jgi:hypothetical protein
MKVVKAAAVQLSPVLYGREGTVDKVVRQISTRRLNLCSRQPRGDVSPRSTLPVRKADGGRGSVRVRKRSNASPIPSSNRPAPTPPVVIDL